MLRANSPVSLSVSTDGGSQYAPAAWVRARTAPAPAELPKRSNSSSSSHSQRKIKKNTTLAALTLLPEDFEPQINHVICGRGKKSYGHVGNQRFLAIVRKRVQDYADAATKHQKSDIVQSVVEEIEANGKGGFIRLDAKTGRYLVAEEGAGREKTSQAVRDGLDNKYKSSKAIKRHNRKEKRLARQSIQGSVKSQRRASTGSNSTTSTRKTFVKRVVSQSQDVRPAPKISSSNLSMPFNFMPNMPSLSLSPPCPQPLLPTPITPALCCGKRRAVSMDTGSSSTICCDAFKLRSLSGNLEQYVATDKILDYISKHNYAVAVEQQDETERTEEMMDFDDDDLEPLPLDQQEPRSIEQQSMEVVEELEPLPITTQQMYALDVMEPFDLNIF